METLSIPIQELLDKAPHFTTKDLAEIYGTDYGTIYRILGRYKVKAKTEHVVKTRLTKELLESVFEEPRTLKEAAGILQTNIHQVNLALKRHSMIRGNKKNVKGKFQNHRLIQMLAFMIKNPQENNVVVGKKFSCTREYVRQVKQVAVEEGIIQNECRTNLQHNV
jgi:hypothetical protein